jgi:hypothetical protein
LQSNAPSTALPYRVNTIDVIHRTDFRSVPKQTCIFILLALAMTIFEIDAPENLEPDMPLYAGSSETYMA